MSNSPYDEVVETLLFAERLEVYTDEGFNLASFRSYYYRYAKTELGRLMCDNKTLHTDLVTDEDGREVAVLVVRPVKQFRIKSTGVPNAPTT